MVADAKQRTGWVVLRRLPPESSARAIVVTLLVCMLSSALIATAVNVLRPYQERNRAQQRARHIEEVIASVPGLADVLGSLAEARVETRLVDLASGSYAAEADANGFDSRGAARDPDTSLVLPPERDLAGIGRRAHHAAVFLVYEDGRLRLLVLPVYGAGYVSTLYGYLALDPDLQTVRGLSFYEHGETPGLGSEIENPRWREQWSGKRLRDPTGKLRIGVARGRVSAGDPYAAYEVDGISGATRTGTGVTKLLHFWLGSDGFGPYLAQLEQKRGAL